MTFYSERGVRRICFEEGRNHSRVWIKLMEGMPNDKNDSLINEI